MTTRPSLFLNWSRACEYPVMMHAPSVGFGEERMRDYRLASSVGRPFDECLSIARLIVRGVFERHPNLKFVGCHLGGGICDVIGRMDYAYELGDLASGLGPYEPMLITKRPSEYLKKLLHGHGRLSSAGGHVRLSNRRRQAVALRQRCAAAPAAPAARQENYRRVADHRDGTGRHLRSKRNQIAAAPMTTGRRRICQ